MSCPNPNPGVPLARRGLDLDGDEQLPWQFYVLTLAMILGMVGLPMLYRKTWVFVADLIADAKEDIAPLPPPTGCRRLGRSTTAPNKGSKEALYIYPITSTPAVELDAAAPLALDRAFALAQRVTSQPDPKTYTVHETWTALTHRSHPRLSQLTTEVWIPDSSDSSEDDGANNWRAAGGCLVLRFPFSADGSVASRAGLRALLARVLVAVRARSLSATPTLELHVPLRPDTARASSYQVELVRMPDANEKGDGRERKAWDVGGVELDEEALAKLAFCLGVSNPLSLFFAVPSDGQHGFQD
jgi:hypothetical protein